MRAIWLAAILALAGCQLDEPSIGGTIVSVMEAELGEEPEVAASASAYEHPLLVPEVAWRLEVQLDDGNAVTVTTEGPRRHEPGERVLLLKDDKGELLL